MVDAEPAPGGETGGRLDMTIDAEMVRNLAERARAISAAVMADYDDGHEHEAEFDDESLVDRHAHDGLQEEEAEDMTDEELTSLIDSLNVDAACELVAIAWIGRGDFDGSDWPLAVAEARDRAVGPTAKYLLGMPLLADYLEGGLDALGI